MTTEPVQDNQQCMDQFQRLPYDSGHQGTLQLLVSSSQHKAALILQPVIREKAPARIFKRLDHAYIVDQLENIQYKHQLCNTSTHSLAWQGRQQLKWHCNVLITCCCGHSQVMRITDKIQYFLCQQKQWSCCYPGLLEQTFHHGHSPIVLQLHPKHQFSTMSKSD